MTRGIVQGRFLGGGRRRPLVAWGVRMWESHSSRRNAHPAHEPSLAIDPRRVSPDAQPWSARTADGLTLRGWYLPTRGTAPVDCPGARHVELMAGDGRTGPRPASRGSMCCFSTSEGTGRATRRV